MERYLCEAIVPSDTTKISKLIEAVLALASDTFSDRSIFAIRLSLEEALVNAVKHGNKRNLTKKVDFHCTVDSDGIFIRVIDEGSGFNPASIPDPTEEENLEKASGRGLMLIRSYMTDVKWNSAGNQIEMSLAAA